MEALRALIRKVIGESFGGSPAGGYSDKYSGFKGRWRKDNGIGDLEVPPPFRTETYVFGLDASDEATGFLVELHFGPSLIGQFHCFYNEDDSYEGAEGVANDIELDADFRNMGLGKVLTLKAIDVSNSLKGYFASDSRSLSPEQANVYGSLRRQKAIDGADRLDHVRAQEVVDKVVADFVARNGSEV